VSSKEGDAGELEGGELDATARLQRRRNPQSPPSSGTPQIPQPPTTAPPPAGEPASFHGVPPRIPLTERRFFGEEAAGQMGEGEE
jgi:hypothetical protein